MATTGDLLRCKTCVFITPLRAEMLEHSVAFLHQYAQHITATVTNGEVKMNKQSEVINLEGSEYLSERSEYLSERSQWRRDLLLPIAKKTLERRGAAMTPAQRRCAEEWLADERLGHQMEAAKKVKAQQKVEEMERLKNEAEAAEKRIKEKKVAKRMAAKERAAKRERARMIALETQATKTDPTNEPQQPHGHPGKYQAKHEGTKIRKTGNAEECRGQTIKGSGDEVNNGRTEEKQEGEEIRDELARTLADGEEQVTSDDQIYTTAKSAKRLDLENVVPGRETMVKILFLEHIAFEQLLLNKLRLDEILEHLPPADVPAEDLDLLADNLPTDSHPKDNLLAQNSTFLSSMSISSICFQAAQFLRTLKLWKSSTGDQSELLITRNDRHVRVSPNLMQEDAPLSNRASMRATNHQETNQNDDQSLHLAVMRSNETCTQLVVKRNHLWGTGSNIRLTFLNGTPQQRQDVMGWIKEWEQHANINFVEVDQEKSDIRISFEIGGCWSYVGTKALEIPKKDSTVGLGITPWNTSAEVRRVVLHEFGHVLGCLHEHQSPHNPLLFEEKATCKYFADKHKWDEAATERDVLRMYKSEEVDATRYDIDSIMHYPFPNSIFSNTVDAIPENYDLSETDKKKIGRLYPFCSSSKKVQKGPATMRKSSRMQQTNWALQSNVFGMSPTNMMGTSTSEHRSQSLEPAQMPLLFEQDALKWQGGWLILLWVAAQVVVGLWALSRLGNI
ncbi:uncharacterized protein PAC_10630 [Phialocephala subalpina]|uniref:Peptidase M12A domain-containing protein n=1 Tax=Phialocephala subalpina TaxID=576137 RepID=A0A1L7X6T2_9HELO|nr:uncharacterized protein PAC_10630 [Phialocephala subalpina]